MKEFKVGGRVLDRVVVGSCIWMEGKDEIDCEETPQQIYQKIIYAQK